MTLPLTLVPDNHLADTSETETETETESMKAVSPSGIADKSASTAWVHKKWVPRRPLVGSRLTRLMARRPRLEDQRGAVTAEYAIVIMAAVAFAGLLVAIMRSGEIRAMLVQLVESALGAAG